MIGEHCAAEYSTPVTVRGATFDKWEVRPDRPDNHLLDVLVGCAVGASVLGVQFSATADGKAPVIEPRKPLSFADKAANRVPPPAAGGRKPLRFADKAAERGRR
jgi:hypothetical protein